MACELLFIKGEALVIFKCVNRKVTALFLKNALFKIKDCALKGKALLFRLIAENVKLNLAVLILN